MISPHSEFSVLCRNITVMHSLPIYCSIMDQDEVKIRQRDNNLETVYQPRLYRKQPAAYKFLYIVFCFLVQSVGNTVISLYQEHITYSANASVSFCCPSCVFIRRSCDTAYGLLSDLFYYLFNVLHSSALKCVSNFSLHGTLE